MFIVYHSNSLELFMRLVVGKMSNYRLSHPMQSEFILVENRMIEKWIEIELSNYFGISANIVFMDIRSFMQKISDEILFTGLKIRDFSYSSMYWKLMNILPKFLTHKNCSIIQKYLLNDVNQQKCGQLSMRVAKLFSKYLIYRLDWLESWRTNRIIENLDVEHQVWQSEIWRMFLSQHMKYISDKLNPLERCLCLLQNGYFDINDIDLPSRIFIYAVVSIPPIYWKILKLLSYKIDIYVWIIGPIADNQNDHHCYNIQNSKRITHILHTQNISRSLKLVKKQYSSSLLSLWGDFGRDTLFLLDQLEDLYHIKAFVIPKTNSMLHVLQRHILEDHSNNFWHLEMDKYNFVNTRKINYEKYIIESQDQSVTIHECHYIQREIEILHDNLSLILSNDTELLPKDILVMAPNISDYKSAIKNVFSNIFDRQLPFAISSNYEYTSPVISKIFQIFDLWCSRFTSEEILSFLSILPILSKFHIDIQEVELIRTLIIESGIRWGLDRNTMKVFDLPITDQNTWYFGLTRMLLGYAMNNHQTGLWEDIYSYDYVNEGYIGIISKLGVFFNVLRKWRDRLSHSYVLKEWIPYMQEMIDDFFDCTHLNVEENKMLFLLKTYWVNILESGIRSGYLKKVNIVVLKDQLRFKLNRTQMDCRFSPNVINFCDITPYCVPCKVLCIIGINDGEFPRKSHISDFDLIFKKKRLGDYNIYSKDCYTFLLACLLPKKRLYISYLNKMENYNTVIKNSSTLVDEFLEYIAKNFCLITDQNLNIKDNLKNLRKHLFYQYSYTPFDSNNFIFNSKKKSFAKEWLDAAKSSRISDNDLISYNSFETSLPIRSKITVILLQDLIRFYQHPIRTWFQKRLGVYFYVNNYNNTLINDEPFSINNADRFLLNTKLINYIIHKKNTEVLYQESCAAGILPHGSFGKLYWNDQYEQMNNLANQISIYYSNEIYKLGFDLMFNEIKLIGNLNVIQKHGLVRWKVARINMKDCFLLWLEHLIYCSVGGHGDSRLFGINMICHFPNLAKSIAKNLLFLLIRGYCIGMNSPLMLLYRSGGIWMDLVFDRKSNTVCSDRIQQNKAYQQLVKAWQGVPGTCFAIGEYQDPYLRKLIPFDLNEENIQKITNTAKQYFLSVMQYRIS